MTTTLKDPSQIAASAPSNLRGFAKAIVDWLKLAQQQINRISNGSISGCPTASTSPPAAGSVTLYAQGDFIRNSAPTVQGTTGSQYVVTGWICVLGGTPGTWVACHSLTGT
jgi:hypothetical protein